MQRSSFLVTVAPVAVGTAAERGAAKSVNNRNKRVAASMILGTRNKQE